MYESTRRRYIATTSATRRLSAISKRVTVCSRAGVNTQSFYFSNQGIAMLNELSSYTSEQFCYLTTIGRGTGQRHEIEIWFALSGTTLYMLSGGRYHADWVKNIECNPVVQVRIRDRVFSGHGRVVDESSEEAILARTLVGPKYGEWRPGQPKRGWTWTALPVAVDLQL